MRRACAIAVLAVVLLGAGCRGGVRSEGALRVRENTIERFDDGTLRVALLAEPAEIAGIPCTGWTRFHPGGGLEETELARDSAIAGQPIPAGSRVRFLENGDFLSTLLSRNTVLDGLPCDGGPLKCETRFHPNGRVRATFLYEDATIQGVPCASTSFASVRFDEAGRLVGCKLSRAATVGGRQFAAGALLEWRADGSVAER